MSALENSFYVTGGTLRHNAPIYVERQADKDLLEGLHVPDLTHSDRAPQRVSVRNVPWADKTEVQQP